MGKESSKGKQQESNQPKPLIGSHKVKKTETIRDKTKTPDMGCS
ncbi:small acid-soluble spore protein P [Siminovitchia acidinfaciens]|nr:small acid-soluble spore protein P [Siminovitchia acidinfaciens]